MKQLDSDFTQEKNKETNKPIFLYEIYDYDGQGNNLYFTEYYTNIKFGNPEIEYQVFPITFEFIGEQVSGEVDEVKITLGNVSRLIQGYLELYDLRDKKVRILQIFKDTFDDPNAFIEWIFYIDRYDADQHNVIFYLTSKFDIRDIKLPRRIVLRTHCQWKFNSIECGYSGSANECNKTLQRCRELGNKKRYGGFPSAGGKRMFV